MSLPKPHPDEYPDRLAVDEPSERVGIWDSDGKTVVLGCPSGSEYIRSENLPILPVEDHR